MSLALDTLRRPPSHMSKMKSKWLISTWLIFIVQLAPAGVSADDMDVPLEDLQALSDTSKNYSVQGNATCKGEYPYTVVFYESKVRLTRMGHLGSPICSGAVISARWILTTVSPLAKYPLHTYFMVGGMRSVSRIFERVKASTYNIYYIEMIIIYPGWQEHKHQDVAMAKTTRPLAFGQELGSLRIPHSFILANGTQRRCRMSIWATEVRNNLMSIYQSLPISKQTLHFKISNGQEGCGGLIFSNRLLCVTQDNLQTFKDVCRINYGAIIQCDCGAVGLFHGVKGNLDCVDSPPLHYTAVNLTKYRKWIRLVNDAIIPDEHDPRKYTSSSPLNLRFNLILFSAVFQHIF